MLYRGLRVSAKAFVEEAGRGFTGVGRRFQRWQLQNALGESQSKVQNLGFGRTNDATTARLVRGAGRAVGELGAGFGG